MNIHHLELFYYVARHGGINEAVRHMPYGIQQPAVSGQILQLEAQLGLKLFARRPFQLTSAGEKLYAFVQPFFGNVDRVESEIRGHAAQFIRFGASNAVLRTHSLDLFRAMRQRIPGLRVMLHDVSEAEAQTLIENDEIDLAVTILPPRLAAGICGERLLQVRLALVVPEDAKLRTTAELWKRDSIDEPLVSLPAADAVTRRFHQGLAQLAVEWPSTVVVNSLDMVDAYTASGFGLTLEMPGVPPPAGLRRLPIMEIEPLDIGMMWANRPSPLLQAFVEEIRARASVLARSVPVEKPRERGRKIVA
jgi:DNA-binding transcriptional LysR family regulator